MECSLLERLIFLHVLVQSSDESSTVKLSSSKTFIDVSLICQNIMNLIYRTSFKIVNKMEEIPRCEVKVKNFIQGIFCYACVTEVS